MKKVFKRIAIVLGALIFLILILAAGLLLSIPFYSPPDPYTYARYWPKDLDYETADRIAVDLVSRMTLDEKLKQMSGDVSMMDMARFGTSYLAYGELLMLGSGENERLHIPPFTFSDGPRGVVVAEATTFPVAMARGATWDRDLESRVGDAIGREMRAAGANYFGGVCINLLRHPAWGRAQETFGEDPWHLGQMGVSLIHGVQQHNVMACAKHYALNSIERSRFKVDVKADERTLHEVYLPHFKRAVDAGVASVMSAYNKVNGEYCGENKVLLTDVLRDDWKFKGFVSSDWLNGVYDGTRGVRAGLDVEMPLQQHYSPKEIKPAIDAGVVTMAQIDETVRRIVRTKLMFVSRTDPQAYPKNVLASEPHRALAREAAEKSMVLLKNEGEVLPFNTRRVKKLAVIGDLADNENIGDRGSSMTHSPHVVTILEGLRQYSNGRFSVVFNDGSDIASARQAAARADAVVLVVGYAPADEGEYLDSSGKNADSEAWGLGGDRPNLFLKPHDRELLKAVLPDNRQAVVTLVGGSGIMTNEWDRLAPSILMAWYPGMMGGEALAKILFGRINPSGKLPLTVPLKEDDLPFFQADVDSITYGYYHGYTLLDKNHIEPAYAFGYGLSYTKFRYTDVRVDKRDIGVNDTIRVSVDVTNEGKRGGDEIVQLYVGFESSKVDRPVKLLRGFARTTLKPGETKAVTIPVAAVDLAWYNPKTRAWLVDRQAYSVFIGGSSRAKDLIKTSFQIH